MADRTSEAIWVEKYRPTSLKEMVGQDAIVPLLKSYAEKKSMPHLLFAGPPGSGKTTAALALARDLFGSEWRQNFLETNASDERGIDTVRTTIKQYARTAPIGDIGFKILFLDEADALTPDAQAALRRTMESYAASCRFILSCNYSSRIIDPIQSRCAIYRFRPLDRKAIAEEIRRIAGREGLTVSEKAVDAIVYIAQGDMRKAVNALQGAAILSPDIQEKMVYEITANARPEEIGELLDLSLSGDFEGAERVLDRLLRERGIAPAELLGQCYRALVARKMDLALKVCLIDALGETDFRLSEGADSEIQMEALVARFVLAAREGR